MGDATSEITARGRVALVCGPAGAGKSTYARRLEKDGWILLAFDEEAWSRGHREHPLDDTTARQIHGHLQVRLVERVLRGSDVVVDTSFWSRASRDAYRRVLSPWGVGPVVHYLDTPRDVVLGRLAERRNAASDDIVVTPERAAAYVDRFEVPTTEEGPLVVVPWIPDGQRHVAPVHRVAAAVLVEGSRALLGLRSRDRRWFPGVWDLPGGHLEEGETSAEALVRELREELAIEAVVEAVELVAHRSTDTYEMDVFVVRDWEGTVRNAAPAEHDELRFVTLAELPALSLADEWLVPLLTSVLRP